MDQTQLEKRVAWLDDEHRKDKNLIAMLEERINALESRIVSTEQKNKELSGETTRLSSVLARMDSFDASIEQHRTEFNKMFKKQATQSDQRVDEITTLLRAEIHAFDASLRFSFLFNSFAYHSIPSTSSSAAKPIHSDTVMLPSLQRAVMKALGKTASLGIVVKPVGEHS